MVLVVLQGGPADGLSTGVREPTLGAPLGFNVAGWPPGDYVLLASPPDRGGHPLAVWVADEAHTVPVPDDSRPLVG